MDTPALPVTTTLLGTGKPGFGDAPEGPQTDQPFGVVLGADDCVYFCEVGNHRIRCVQPASGRVRPVAGTGIAGYDGDGGSALQAAMDEPYELCFDRTGNLYFVDMKRHVVRCIDAGSGVIRTVAGNGTAGLAGDGGLAIRAALNQPHSIALDGKGALYIADIGNHRIRKVDLDSGTIDTFAGTGGKGPTADGATLRDTDLFGPRALAFDADGNMLLALREGNAIYRIDMQGETLHHVAGTGKFGYAGDGGDARLARLAGPKGICGTATGGIIIADTESHTLREIDRHGIIRTVMGTGAPQDGPDGDPLGCGLARPHGVFADGLGRIYVGDSDNHRLRMLSPSP